MGVLAPCLDGKVLVVLAVLFEDWLAVSDAAFACDASIRCATFSTLVEDRSGL